VLDTTVTPALAAEGLARDVVRAVQQGRREAGLQVSDRIRLTLAGDADVRAAVDAHQQLVSGETLATDLVWSDALSDSTQATVGERQEVRFQVSKV
jgi:isoleucyl-tRNA synthetase